jgi:hypothetical protein
MACSATQETDQKDDNVYIHVCGGTGTIARGVVLADPFEMEDDKEGTKRWKGKHKVKAKRALRVEIQLDPEKPVEGFIIQRRPGSSFRHTNNALTLDQVKNAKAQWTKAAQRFRREKKR